MKNWLFEEDWKSEESEMINDPREWDCWSHSAKIGKITSESDCSNEYND